MTILETERLVLRHLTPDDLDDLAALMADPVVMRYFPSTRTHEEAQRNLDHLIAMYEQHGFGLWATIHKQDNRFIGRCGLLPQIIDGVEETEVGYMLAKAYWNQGLATEAARAIRDYGFHTFPVSRLISLIRPENLPSQRVAEKNGMRYEKDTLFHGLTHRVYAVECPE